MCQAAAVLDHKVITFNSFSMRIWGIHKKNPYASWWANFMGGHLNFWGIAIFGANAMRWAVSIKTKRWGYICFTLPVKARWIMGRDGKWRWNWYFYLSPDGTPSGSTFYRGSDKSEVIRAQIRRLNLGHGFSTRKMYHELYAINRKFYYFHLSESDLQEFKPDWEYD